MFQANSPVHIMVDIETLDTDRTAVILSIGAVTIPSMLGNEFKSFYVECYEYKQYERTASQDTINWWAKQPSGLMPKGTILLTEALKEFKLWIEQQRAEPIMWCKGTDFDTAILAHAFQQYKIPVPWKYNAIRDVRTLEKILSVASQKNENPHNALADALHQSRKLQQIMLEYNLVLA